MCASQSGGSGAAPFSGASVQNITSGQTLVPNLQAGPVFLATSYDIGAYLAGGDHFVVPKTGYYGVLFGFQADGPFVGAYEVGLKIGGAPISVVSGVGTADQVPECQVYDEGRMTAGNSVLFQLVQRSGSDQLVYPYARIHFLGS